MYVQETIAIVEIVNISIMAKSFLVPLGGKGRFFRCNFFSEKYVCKVTSKLNDKKENSKQGRAYMFWV